MENSELTSSSEYQTWLGSLKSKFQQAQNRTTIAVNIGLLTYYWELGQEIISQQSTSIHGEGLLKQLSQDLCLAFPSVKGFSVNNLQYIRRWTAFYLSENVEQLVPHSEKKKIKCGTACSTFRAAPPEILQIPWGHNLKIISKCQNKQEALFYVRHTITHGWSRAVLTHQIESGLHEREGTAISNFAETLPPAQSDLAQQTLKDPYIFDFLALTENYNERDLENQLTEHITNFLIELGAGFAYLGRQVPLIVSTREFFLDLLFYHTQLHCYVVIELKTADFDPEHAGKLNFYLKAVDESMRSPQDNPSIGILICKTSDSLVAEYALSDINKPIGVSEYQLTQALPETLKSKLPSVASLEAELKQDLKTSEHQGGNHE